MITCKMMGGLGNNLFQLAAIYNLHKKYNVPYFTPASITRLSFDGGLLMYEKRFKQSNRYEIPLLFENDFNYYDNKKQASLNMATYNHRDLNGACEYKELPVLENTIYNGYFQSDKYFSDFNVHKEWKIKEKIVKYINHTYKELHEKPTISLHFRMAGDRKLKKIQHYYGSLPLSFYEEGIENILKIQNTCLDDYNILLFSDNAQEAQEFFSSTGIKTHTPSGKNNIEDFVHMSLCTHNIIANSTYGWWAAYMNKNDSKVIVAPKSNFYGPGYNHLNLVDFFPQDWVTL